MMSDTTIVEFCAVVKEETGAVLDRATAQKILADLVGYFNLLGKIAHRENLDTKGRTVSPLNKNRLNTF